MGDWISYQGKTLGKIIFDSDIRKPVFIAESLGDLATLLNIKSTDEIESDDRGKMLYEQFREDSLAKISSFYPTTKDWLLREI